MSLLSASEMAAIQSVARSGMASTATILKRITIVTDDGQESAWATSGDDVPCWVYEITSSSTDLHPLSGAVNLVELFNVRVPVGTDADSGDHVAVGSTIYDVQHTSNEDTYPTWLILTCRAAVS